MEKESCIYCMSPLSLGHYNYFPIQSFKERIRSIMYSLFTLWGNGRPHGIVLLSVTMPHRSSVLESRVVQIIWSQTPCFLLLLYLPSTKWCVSTRERLSTVLLDLLCSEWLIKSFSGTLLHIIFLLICPCDYSPSTLVIRHQKGSLGMRANQVSWAALLITIHRSQILGHMHIGDIRSWCFPVPRDQFPLELLQRSLNIR